MCLFSRNFRGTKGSPPQAALLIGLFKMNGSTIPIHNPCCKSPPSEANAFASQGLRIGTAQPKPLNSLPLACLWSLPPSLPAALVCGILGCGPLGGGDGKSCSWGASRACESLVGGLDWVVLRLGHLPSTRTSASNPQANPNHKPPMLPRLCFTWALYAAISWLDSPFFCFVLFFFRLPLLNKPPKGHLTHGTATPGLAAMPTRMMKITVLGHRALPPISCPPRRRR